MKKGAILTAGLLAMPVPAHAADWWAVSSTGNGVHNPAATFVDADSIVRVSTAVVQAWSLTIFMRPQEGGFTSMRVLSEFHCESRTARGLTLLRHRPDGSLVSSYSGLFDLIRLAPETAGEAEWRIVCGNPDPSSVRLRGLRGGAQEVTPQEFAETTFRLNEAELRKKLAPK